MNMEENMILPSFQPTGEFCDICGAELNIFIAKFFCKVRQFPVACKCKQEATKQRELEDKLRKKRDYLDSLFKQARLGERLKYACFENYKTTDETQFIFDKLKNYAENFSENKKISILLNGPPGTGKTLIACSVLNTVLRKGIPSIFISVPDLFSQLSFSYSSNSDVTENKILYGLTDCDLLILDEIGLRKPKEVDGWATEKLYQIINARYSNMCATIFTTNCNLNELSDRLGFRAFSRIMEMCSEMNFDFSKATDWRMRNVFENTQSSRT